MKEDIYKDLYDNHIKKYEELLEKNVITEYEFNKIKKDIYLKEQLSQKDINDFQNTNKVKEKLTLKEFFLELVKLISNLLKILCAIFVLITAIAIERAAFDQSSLPTFALTLSTESTCEPANVAERASVTFVRSSVSIGVVLITAEVSPVF